MKIFIDAGHGGDNPGAIGVNGIEEADITLDVALRLGRILKNRGYSIMYSRTEDKTVSLVERAEMANVWDADYFVSIHCNSNVNPNIKGTSTYYYRTGIRAEKLAEDVNTALVEMINTPDLGIFTANFAVLRRTKMPAILVELAFLSNPTEAELLSQAYFRENCAIGIANGIDRYIYG